MKEEKSAVSALRSFQIASQTAKVLRIAHVAAMGVAAASLVVGGVRVAKKFKGE